MADLAGLPKSFSAKLCGYSSFALSCVVFKKEREFESFSTCLSIRLQYEATFWTSGHISISESSGLQRTFRLLLQILACFGQVGPVMLFGLGIGLNSAGGRCEKGQQEQERDQEKEQK